MARGLGNNGTWSGEVIWLTGICLKPSWVPHLIQIGLRGRPKISFQKQVSLPESLWQKRGGGSESSQ